MGWINFTPVPLTCIKGIPSPPTTGILGTSWPTMPEGHETGNDERKRKGREMRAGLRPYPTYPAKKVGPQFDENGKYIYPPGSGFNWMEKIDPNSPWNCTGGKVS